MKFLLLFVLAALNCALAWQQRVALPPLEGKNGRTAVLILIQGASLSGKQYVETLTQIQNASDLQLWAATSDFVLNLPNPLGMPYEIETSMKKLSKLGLTGDVPVFVAGHSLGGIASQNFLSSKTSENRFAYIDNNNKQHEYHFGGQILLGSFLARKYENSFAIPTMTIGGEYDGLCRITRIMEASFKWNMNTTDEIKQKYPVVYVPGMSHMQFASGKIPNNVRKNDLKPEISDESAKRSIGNLVSNWISETLGNEKSQATLTQVQKAIKYFQPLVKAFNYEGYAFFKMPCNLVENGTDCLEGSSFVEYAQVMLAGKPKGVQNFAVSDHDVFHRVYHLPDVKLPEIKGTCEKPENCTVYTKTVSQNTYSAQAWTLDTGLYPISAYEVRAKMSSRQRILNAAGVRPVPQFNETDNGDLCGKVNQYVYEWALKNAGEKALAKFKSVGQPLMIGPDKYINTGGVSWIWTSMSWDVEKTVDGVTYRLLQSVGMKTPLDYLIKSAAGFHYCKLLSPARAMEWIYVDGLKPYNHI